MVLSTHELVQGAALLVLTMTVPHQHIWSWAGDTSHRDKSLKEMCHHGLRSRFVRDSVLSTCAEKRLNQDLQSLFCLAQKSQGGAEMGAELSMGVHLQGAARAEAERSQLPDLLKS